MVNWRNISINSKWPGLRSFDPPLLSYCSAVCRHLFSQESARSQARNPVVLSAEDLRLIRIVLRVSAMNEQGEQAANIMLSALLCGRYMASVQPEARAYSLHALPLDRLSQEEMGVRIAAHRRVAEVQ